MAQNLKERAYTHIRQRIVEGRIAAGERLSEVQIAKDIGISRTPVREAVHLLASEGLVELLPGYGAFVPLPNANELRDLFGLREALECYAVQEAVVRIDPERIAALTDCCRRHFQGIRLFKTSGRAELDEEMELLIGEADVAFHRILLESSGNQWVLKIVSDLRLMSRVLGRRIDASQKNLLAVLVFVYRCHRRVLGAVRRRDAAGAASWMRVHIRGTRELQFRHLAAAPTPDVPLYPSLRRAVSRLEHFDGRLFAAAQPYPPNREIPANPAK